MPSKPALDLIDLAMKATHAYGRPDLTERLTVSRRRVADPDLRVLVVGEFKQGKSALVNALLSAEVCPVDDDISTSVTTAVKYSADKPSVTIVRETAGPADGDVRQERTDVPLAELQRYVSEAGNPGNRENVDHVEVAVPRKILATGLVIVDTPGVGGLGSAHGAMTMAALPTADAILLVSDAATEYTAPELRFAAQARALCPNVACVLTKTDLYPEWRRIAALDRGHLDRAGIRAEMLPVSSVLRRVATATSDAALNEESGFKALVAYLRDNVVGKAETLDRRTASQDVLSAVEQMSYKMRTELAAQQNPGDADALIAQLTAAKQRAEDLKKRSARWQTTLADGFGDLQSDIDHDFRDRMRALAKEAEELLDSEDPGAIWEQFAEWFQAQAAQAASTNFVWATQRAQHLSQQVADHFVAGGTVALPDVSRGSSRELGSQVTPMIRPEMAKFKIGAALLTGLKGGQGGMVMFGMVTSLAGMAMLNPITGTAALLLGAKGVRDEKKRLLTKRRADAKQAMRKHIDEVTFSVGKDSRDMLRLLQRTRRTDHGGLVVDLEGHDPETVDRLTVDWPSAGLRTTSLIDTPGIASLTSDTSARAGAFLTPDEAPSQADAVLYLMRHLHSADARFLESFHDRHVARAAPVSTIAVLSRADEIGAGRLDALDSARRIAGRYRTDDKLSSLCQTVVAVAGLVALSGRTLRQDEYLGLRALAAGDPDLTDALLLSADRFVTPPDSLRDRLGTDAPDAAGREALLRRMGVFGVRTSLAALRDHAPDASQLSAEVVAASGLDELREVLATQFGERRDLLKARSALLAVELVLRTEPRPESAALAADVERIFAGAHEFAELTLLAALRSKAVTFPPEPQAEAERLIGGDGSRATSRLGLDPEADAGAQRAAVVDALARWRKRSANPLAARTTVDACGVVVRSCEGMLARLVT